MPCGRTVARPIDTNHSEAVLGSQARRQSSGVTAQPPASMDGDSGADCMDFEEPGAEDLSVSLALHVVLHDGGSDGYTLKHLVTGEQARLEGGAGLLHGQDLPRQSKIDLWWEQGWCFECAAAQRLRSRRFYHLREPSTGELAPEDMTDTTCVACRSRRCRPMRSCS